MTSNEHTRRRRVLLSAYACKPGRGSEPGVGWNAACEMARHHDVWVLTRTSNREAIEEHRSEHALPPGLRFVYHDFWALSDDWNRDEGKLTSEAHYYTWQVSAYFKARRLHREVGFDLAHHITYIRYWTPSLMALLPIPFVLGPVGGAETAPAAFWKDLGRRARRFEKVRDAARWIAERDPLVRRSVRRSTVALSTTRQTAARLRHLQAPRVEIHGACGVTEAEVERLGNMAAPPERPVRFLSLGRLLHWKGFHLGLRAFAQAGLEDAEYWIVGDGPWRERLEAEARALGVCDRVRFWGWLERPEALEKLAASHALVHPSLHDSDGTVCLEAMAARRPVLCLDTGGPGHQVTSKTGIKVPVRTPDQAARDLAAAMRTLANDASRRARMGEAGHQRVKKKFTWERRMDTLLRVQESAMHA